MNYPLIPLAMIMAIGSAAYAAEPTTFSFHQKVFPQDATQSCQIKRFTVTNKKMFSGDETSIDHYTSMAAVIETTKPDCVRKYAVVQWIHGCVSNQTFRKSTGELSEKYWGSDRDFRGGQIVFDHPEWTVDTTDVDPMYQSNDSGQGDRMDWYYVSKNALKLKGDNASLVADDKVYDNSANRWFLQNPAAANTKQILVTDLPDTANYYQEAQYDLGVVTTPSLEFKVCLYETKDVPLTGDPASPDTPHALGGPLQCYEWDHKFNFNPVTRDFERITTPGVDPFCMSPTPTPEPVTHSAESGN